MPEPKRWPVNANWARKAAIDATEDAIDALIDVMGALGEGDRAELVTHVKRVIRLLHYVVRILVYAKFGEKAGELPAKPEE